MNSLKKTKWMLLAAIVCVALSAKPAAAEEPWKNWAGDFAIGWNHFTISKHDATRLNDADDAGGRVRFSTPISASVPQLRFGASIGASYYEKREGDRRDDNWSREELSLLTPEASISWCQPVGRYFQIEPGVGIDPIVAYYRNRVEVDDVRTTDVEKTRAGIAGRPFVRGIFGPLDSPIYGGVEASYTVGYLNLGDQRTGLVGELFVGLFMGFRF